jgi:hypothetical protein
MADDELKSNVKQDLKELLIPPLINIVCSYLPKRWESRIDFKETFKLADSNTPTFRLLDRFHSTYLQTVIKGQVNGLRRTSFSLPLECKQIILDFTPWRSVIRELPNNFGHVLFVYEGEPEIVSIGWAMSNSMFDLAF